MKRYSLCHELQLSESLQRLYSQRTLVEYEEDKLSTQSCCCSDMLRELDHREDCVASSEDSSAFASVDLSTFPDSAIQTDLNMMNCSLKVEARLLLQQLDEMHDRSTPPRRNTLARTKSITTLANDIVENEQWTSSYDKEEKEEYKKFVKNLTHEYIRRCQRRKVKLINQEQQSCSTSSYDIPGINCRPKCLVQEDKNESVSSLNDHETRKLESPPRKRNKRHTPRCHATPAITKNISMENNEHRKEDDDVLRFSITFAELTAELL